ncbi:transglutaminase domain-containing protein [Winogradskyella helgolandensis]|uniref:transglutaminase domain-containing protein n=1 Tax=Winogradskyella helgolandensis TaxID=2697010 RepID=UPI0015CD856B|nr:transglutaminase domain-containing protein [Winogradskyella helgolandensis]
MKLLINIILILFCITIHSQNYKLIDETVKNYPKFNSIDELASRVNNDFNTDTEKVRAFFTWTTQNISYDLTKYYAVRAPQLVIRFDSEMINKSIANQNRENLAKEIFENRKALCFGYSSLFTELCLKSNIEVKTVNGITKNSVNYINTSNYTKNHSWNVVKIDNQWKLIDLTFAAGYEDLITGEWVIKLNDFYFFTNPEKFILSHLPAQPKFQLISDPVSIKSFFKRPIFYSKYFVSGLQLSNHQTGLLTVSKEDKKISVSFESKKLKGSIYYKFNNEATLKKLRVQKTDIDNYAAIIKCKSDASRTLSFYSENEKILDFKIKN